MKLKIVPAALLASLLLISCEAEMHEQSEPCGCSNAEFCVSLNARTRAPQDLDLNTYTAKVYMFKEETAGSDRFTYLGEEEITGNTFTVEGLTADVRHRFVFMALPKGQTPELPAHTAGKPGYDTAGLTYISGNQTTHEVFRDILTFTPEKGDNAYSIVLTRQNGALQVRMGNANGELTGVKLEVEGMPEMFLHDGTGGKVVTKGSAVQLSKEETPGTTKDYRITVNLLPAEDVTGKGKLTLTYRDGTSKEYALTSTQGGIPIYPNQVTWLTLNGTGDDGDDNDNGNFDVNIGPDINLDDDEWDGIHNQ